MKRIPLFVLAALALLAAPRARAWSYQDGDVLLIFRESGYNDVEFDLGNISQFLNHPNGYTAAVTGWDVDLVTNTFGPDLTGVSVALLATTARSSNITNETAWLSGVEPNTTSYNVHPSAWQAQLFSVIHAIGLAPEIYLPTNTGNSYSIPTSSDPTVVASYDNVVSADGTLGPLPYLYLGGSIPLPLGGNAAFNVEQVIPGSFELWGIQPGTNSPPAPGALVGIFSIATNGVLTFVAGPPPSSILGITRSGGTNSVTFTTTVSGQYQLVHTNNLQQAGAAWPVVPGAVAGDGFVHTLNHVPADAAEFYRVERTP
jgi:hypothetical protein